MSKLHITMSSRDLTPAGVDAVNAVLRTPILSTGPRIEAFERACATYIGAIETCAERSRTIRDPRSAICNSQSDSTAKRTEP